MKTRFNPLFCLMLLATALFAPAAFATVFTVNELSDDSFAHDVAPGDGVCLDSLGACTLRAAIEETNALAGPEDHDIYFSVAGTIYVSEAALPAVTKLLSIDGRTAPGYAGPSVDLENAPPKIYIDGNFVGGAAGSVDGLKFSGSAASGSRVLAIGITRFRTGIIISGSVHNGVVDSCYIGLRADGSADGNNQGIFIGSDTNFIGRIGIGFYGNVISGNSGPGIGIGAASGNVIAGNRIGTTPDGIGARGNGTGIVVLANANSIGLFDAVHDYGNVISGNIGDAIASQGPYNQIVANDIGIGASGAALGNGGSGIKVWGANNTIGSVAAHGENRIANNIDGIVVDGNSNTVTGNQVGISAFSQGNSGDGIRVDAGTGNIIDSNYVLNNGFNGIITLGDSTTIKFNQIGWLDLSGPEMADFGNGVNGIRVESSANYVHANSVGFSGTDGILVTGGSNNIWENIIGQTYAGKNIGNTSDGVVLVGPSAAGNQVNINWIAFNRAGITLSSDAGIGNAMLANLMFSNRDFGIDLLGDGATPNDPGDPDTGPNKLQNFPEIVSLTFDGIASPPELTVEWRIDSTTANSTYPIAADFYLADSAASGQGKVWLGYKHASTPIITNMVTLVLPLDTIGGNLVTTATDENRGGSTSEFSAPVPFGISDTIFANGFEIPR